MERKKTLHSNPPTKYKTECCVNCCQTFTEFIPKIDLIAIPVKTGEMVMSQEYSAREEAVNVDTVLSSLYRLEDSSLKSTSACCFPCASILTQLCKFYYHFQELRQLNSDLDQAISKSLSSQVPPNQIEINSNESSLNSVNSSQGNSQVQESQMTTTNSNFDLTIKTDPDDLFDLDRSSESEYDPLENDPLESDPLENDPLENDPLEIDPLDVDDDSHSDSSVTVKTELPPDTVDQHVGKSKKDQGKKYRRKSPNRNCVPCEETFGSRRDLADHLRDKHGDEQLKCESCKTVFFKKAWYERHIRICRPGQELSCDYCSKKFPPEHFKIFRAHVHGHIRRSKCELCPHCGKQVSDLQALKRHLLIHTNEKPKFECPTCHKCFNYKNVLENHKNLHLGHLFLCQVCGMNFGSKSNLDRHSRVHGTDRPYKCQVPGCDRDFKFTSTLKTHARIHMENRPVKRKGRGLGKIKQK